jgi:pSer/pThr/pTyr-binding forkhead associated (FHA) protein
MSHGLLEILKYFFLGLIWLFFLYAARMVYVEVRRGRSEREAPATEAVVMPVPTAALASDRRVPLQLRVVEPSERRGRSYELGPEVTLGRSPRCIVHLDDRFASGVHARVFERNGELWLEDLGSTNGTWLNDDRLVAPTRLQRGDRVKVGSTVLEVSR